MVLLIGSDGYFTVDNLRILTAIVPPDNSINGTKINPSSPITDNRMRAHHFSRFVEKSGTTASSQTYNLVAKVKGATGTLLSFDCKLTGACVGAATVTFDLQKNGVSVLGAVVSFSSSDSANTVKSGTISSASVVVGDRLDLVIVATAGGGTIGTGASAELRHGEDPQ